MTTLPANGRRQSSGTTSPASGPPSVPSTDVTIPVGQLDPALGRSYAQIAREGWGEQKSQNGGANPTLSGPATRSYHLWAVAPEASGRSEIAPVQMTSLFHNNKVNRHQLAGLARLARIQCRPPGSLPACDEIDTDIKQFDSRTPRPGRHRSAHKLAPHLSPDARPAREGRSQRPGPEPQRPACSSNSTPRSSSSKSH